MESIDCCLQKHRRRPDNLAAVCQLKGECGLEVVGLKFYGKHLANFHKIPVIESWTKIIHFTSADFRKYEKEPVFVTHIFYVRKQYFALTFLNGPNMVVATISCLPRLGWDEDDRLVTLYRLQFSAKYEAEGNSDEEIKIERMMKDAEEEREDSPEPEPPRPFIVEPELRKLHSFAISESKEKGKASRDGECRKFNDTGDTEVLVRKGLVRCWTNTVITREVGDGLFLTPQQIATPGGFRMHVEIVFPDMKVTVKDWTKADCKPNGEPLTELKNKLMDIDIFSAMDSVAASLREPEDGPNKDAEEDKIGYETPKYKDPDLAMRFEIFREIHNSTVGTQFKGNSVAE